MIRIENLHKSFDGNEVFRGISLEIAKGFVLALIGRSGCGKSVLLKHVAGLMKPEKGRVIVDGKQMDTARGKALTALRDRLGFLFQGGALFDSMNVFENVAFPLKEKTRLSRHLIQARVLAELENVGLSGSEYKYPSQISGGMVKRAALARSLVGDPEIMLFDEPTTGLDPVTGHSIIKLIDTCHRRLRFTGIIVTHEISKVFTIVDRVAMLHEGVIWAEGPPSEFFASKDPVVRDFIGESV
ncbi:MAG: ATP-binding cassette domain-containing protein [Deltaproteobacteria bacterium]|nr:ATP-binding cassette domain-containing protein [Deltaproteobacteria bacterium]